MRKYHEDRADQPVVIPKELREKVGLALIAFFRQENHRILAVSVAGMHAHALVELPDEMKEIKLIVGKAKRKASLKVIKAMPGRIWAAGGKFEPVDNLKYQRNCYTYIWEKQWDAWVWSFKDGSRYND